MILESVYFGLKAQRAIENLVCRQGWSNETLGELACLFIAEHNQGHNFLDYLADVATKEKTL
jgi:hypothetical protein